MADISTPFSWFGRLVLGFFLSGSLALGAAVPSKPVEPPAPTSAGNRFLFVVDTSTAMRRLEHGGRQVVFDLVHSGLSAQMQAGDTFGIWTFNKEVQAGNFPMQTWQTNQTLDLASKAGLFLKEQKYEKSPRLDLAIEKGLGLSKAVKDVNLLFVTSGSSELGKCPLDQSFRDQWNIKSLEAIKTKRPLLVAIAVQQGNVVSSTVTVVNEGFNTPKLPVKPVEKSKPGQKAEEKAAAVKPSGTNAPPNTSLAAQTPKPAPPKPPPASIIMQGSRKPVEDLEPPAPTSITLKEAPSDPVPAQSDIAENEPVITEPKLVSPVAVQVPPPKVVVPPTEPTQVVRPQPPASPAAVKAKKPATPNPKEAPRVEPNVIPVAAREPKATPPLAGPVIATNQPILVAALPTQHPAASPRGGWLMMYGLILLFSGVGIGWVIRQLKRPAIQASFITQSFSRKR